MPPRRYELLAEVLVRAAAEQTPGEPLRGAAQRVARRRGVELTRDDSEFNRRSPAPSIPTGASVSRSSRSRTEALLSLLTRLGYNPNQDGDALVLTNCPFQRFRASDTELVCSINAALGAGYLEGLAIDGDVTARLRSCPTNCCVVFEPA